MELSGTLEVGLSALRPVKNGLRKPKKSSNATITRDMEALACTHGTSRYICNQPNKGMHSKNKTKHKKDKKHALRQKTCRERE